MDKLIIKVKKDDTKASNALKQAAKHTKILLKADKVQDKKLAKMKGKC